MNFQHTKTLVAAALLAVTAAAQAETITFDSLTTNQEYFYAPDTYQEGGFSFESTLGNHAYSLFTWGTTSQYDADPTGATLSQDGDDVPLIVVRTGGGKFNLGSFDLADGDNVGGGSVDMTYTDATGKHTQLLVLDSTPGLQTFTFNYTGLTSFSLGQHSLEYQLDNVNVEATGPSASVVPEPESLSLMVGGWSSTPTVAMSRSRPEPADEWRSI